MFFERVQFGLQEQNPVESFMESTSALKFSFPLKIVYILTFGFVLLLSVIPLVRYFWNDYITETFFTYSQHLLSPIFFLNIFPLVIFAVVFLTKGNGYNYFKTWNAGPRLKLSALIIIVGYCSVALPQNPILRLNLGYHDPVSFYFVQFGLSLMVIGFAMIFFLYKKKPATDNTELPEKKGKKLLITSILIIAILSIAIVCLVGINSRLEDENSMLWQDHEFFMMNTLHLVNENWTEYTNGDLSYVNYKAGFVNTGYQETTNITLIVRLSDADYNTLAKEEYYIDEVDYREYHEIDLNISYSGILDHVQAGYCYD